MGAFLAITLPIGFGVGVFYLVVRVSQVTLEKIQQQFSHLADAYKLDYLETEGTLKIFKKFPALQGELNGKTFYLFMYTKGSGKHQKTYTSFRLQTHNPKGYTLKLSKEGFFSKVGKRFGMQDIQVGDAEFDPLYIIQGSDVYFAQSVLTNNVKEQMALASSIFKGTMKVQGDVIEYTELTMMKNREKREMIEQLISIAQALSDSIDQFSNHRQDPA
ncbi:MAG: hypothetical protein AAF598_09880 [Bacteroidota bacterium]